MNYSPSNLPPDSEYKGLAALLPVSLRPFVLLARLERPIGGWLLYWPCLFGMALAGSLVRNWHIALWLFLGAFAMRGAGCVYNDIVDRDLDKQVARTASRPLASGMVSLRAAWVWLFLLCLVGLLVLWQLPLLAQIIAMGSVLLVAAYPFMKRITWWPQAWLGMVFSWGALVGWSVSHGAGELAMFCLYAGCIFWVIGYDTIYAVQDREDDALVGIRSSALRLGGNLRFGVMLFYIFALVCWAAAILQIRPQGQALVALLPAAFHLLWQGARLRLDGANALFLFRSNNTAGLLLLVGFFIVGASA